LTVGLVQPNDPGETWRVVSAVVAPGILYEIDRVISRTLSYTLVTGMIVGVYIGVVTLVTRVLPFSGRPAFQPRAL
jgi:hypothetical protein